MAVTKKLKQQLTLAASALLGHEAVEAVEKDSASLYNSWNVDVGYLRYKEPDRITVDTYMAKISGNLSDKDTIKLGLVFDTLTGSTPSGVLPNNDTVTVTSASGGSGGSAGGGDGTVPFDDTRLAIDTSWGHEWQRLIRSNLSAYVSVEGDYTAIGGGMSIEKDTEDKAYTFTAALGGSVDKVSRSDETTPEALSNIDDAIFFGKGSKNNYDMLFGMSTVINRRTAAMVNLSHSRSLGYLTDPYKMISVADADDVSYGTLYESRPDNRERYILYTKLVHELPKSGHHLDFSYRYHTDSWDVNSHTVEMSYSFDTRIKHLFTPFGRIYHQQAANFYQRTILSDNIVIDSALEHASSDPRLAEMLSVTAGLKYQYRTSATGSIDFRLAYIHRQYEDAIVDDDGTVFFTVDLGKGFD
ncbi:MAG: DUF3570 domain-containing protein [Bermanella sp.]